MIELMLLILCASMAFDISLPSSEEALRVEITFVSGIKALRRLKQWFPVEVSGVPMTTRSGLIRFWIA